MIKRILLAAFAAGALAGVFAHGAQLVEVIPVMHAAEGYEGLADERGHGHGHGHEAHGEEGHGHDHSGWMPADGFERQVFTLMANVLTGVAFGLILVAGFAFSGRHVDWQRGALWGLGGFAVFVLAPAIGVPPAAPGMEVGSVSERQLWWVGTVVATGGGLSLLVFAGSKLLKTLGAMLIAAPHLVGAPIPAEFHAGPLPAELAAQFAVASLVTALAFWAVLGGLAGHFFDRWVQQRT